MGTQKTGTALALAAVLLLAVAGQAMAQAMPKASTIKQVELDADGSVRALKAWESVKKLSDSVDGNDLSQMQALYTHKRFVDAVKSHGFDDVEAWHRTLFTFILSANAIGKEEQFANIPENLKKSMAHLLPKPENVAAAKEALQDPEAARIYKKFQ